MICYYAELKRNQSHRQVFFWASVQVKRNSNTSANS
ncbi:unnamed protein product [Rodentolepis nana]|uniref:Uncharacterized protein n=1 Tax=Rodentolepis nana TaxID=102285 RepID=A0A3P7SI34_RODNA|nr:unnamed protein product [Rodentolepis nana]